ncbi:MAG: YraN family protein [Albimonas sp.]|uniref:YraN family protein n=1 Tax=Albimonas sp. TaxID=1872425 RepID=UPI004055EADF|tara:strand:- start:1092 stop:1493 length:402 start_codon:yes stop_codon:yes gene_type:complete
MTPIPSLPAPDRRRLRGRTSGHLGRAAEERTLRRYLAAGWRLAARNWRAERLHGNGELDLVLERGGVFAFVEVKSRRTLLEAGEAVKPAQIRRLEMAATRFLELAGALDADRRFDLAAFDRHGRMEIVENAFF